MTDPATPTTNDTGRQLGQGRGAEGGVGVLRSIERVTVTVSLDPWLGLAALAKYANLSTRTLRGYLYDAAHPIPHYRVGGKLLVRRSEFDAWMTAHRHVGREDVERLVAEVLRRARA